LGGRRKPERESSTVRDARIAERTAACGVLVTREPDEPVAFPIFPMAWRRSSMLFCGISRAHWPQTAVLAHCANPACTRRFRKMEDGKLFLLDSAVEVSASQKRRKSTSFKRLEHYWLCSACASVLTLSVDRQLGVIAVPLTEYSLQKLPASAQAGQSTPLPSLKGKPTPAPYRGLNEA